MSEADVDSSATNADDVAQDVMYKNIGNKFLLEGHFDRAIDAYTKAITINDKSAVYYANRAQANIKSVHQ
jgi:tetratricopeptide (TPR) repeat protein